MRVMSLIGTRPEAIKMAPVVEELKRRESIESCVVVTGQHREMLDQVLDVFQIVPDYDLAVMSHNQSSTEGLIRILEGLQPVLATWNPDWVLVQGDTTSVLAGALAGAYAGCRIGHVEAGLRTYDRQNPFPEELNRVLVDHASDLLFAPTPRARQALLDEGVENSKVHLTGNTIVDALQAIIQRLPANDMSSVPDGKRLILVTAHRRESHGQPLQSILSALLNLARRDDVHIVYPVHRNPNVQMPVYDALDKAENISLLEPQSYLEFVMLMRQAYLILTDSGGIQEEAPSLGIPVLVMRKVTERPEAVEAGVARLVGTDSVNIVDEATRLLDDPQCYNRMAQAINPFGNGESARLIVDILCDQDR